MGARKKYFDVEKDAPAPLVVRTERRVRFEEVDVLGMVWHGRYPSYFEDGRIAFGDKYGMTYQRFMKEETVAPVVQMHFDYKQPLRFDEVFSIETAPHWTEAARLNFTYKLFNNKDVLVASGYTVQLFTNRQGEMLLFTPQWLKDFQQDWKEGLWQE
jgi:acyl-CoA thioester hydrolase